MNLSLTFIEKQVLFKKYVKSGMSYEQADEKIKAIVKHLRYLVEDLRERNKPEDYINERFRMEFEKICQEAEC